MDIFSVGCVIAELFLETPIFNLGQLFNYRKGEYDPHAAHLHRIENTDIREMVAHMIQVEPESRYSADEYLNFWRDRAFPEYFSSFLHQYMALITDPSSGKAAVTGDESNLGESDDRIARVYNDFDKIAYFLGYPSAQLPHSGRMPILPADTLPLHISPPDKRIVDTKPGEDGTFLFINIVTSSLRSTARSSARVQACDLLLAFSGYISNDAKLDRILPFMITLLDDPSDVVRIAALRTIAHMISSVASTSPVNISVFPEYILPKLADMFVVRRNRPRQSTIVRLAFAQCISPLAEAGAKFLDSAEALKAEGSLPSAGSDTEDTVSIATYQNFYDSTRASLTTFFETQAKQLLTDSEPGIRRTFLSSISSLCVFFGSAKTNDVILSHLNTYLNDRDWRLKCSFFEAIVGVAVYVGSNNLEQFMLPLMILALTDIEEAVLGSILRSLAVMSSLGLFQRSVIVSLIDTLSRFTMHPSPWIRESAADFLTSSVRYLSPADVHCIVIPALSPFLKSPPTTFKEVDFFNFLKKPLSQEVYELAFKWATASSQSNLWKHVKRLDASTRAQERFFAVTAQDLSSTSFAKLPKSESDQQWMTRLRNAGMSRDDEIKLLALAEYVWRVATKHTKESVEADDKELKKQRKLSDLKVQVNTFQVNSEGDIWEPDTQQATSEDSTQTIKPQTISDALLDASATTAGEALNDSADTSLPVIPSAPTSENTASTTKTTPMDQQQRQVSAERPPAGKHASFTRQARRTENTSVGKHGHRGSRSSAMDLMQRRSTGGKAMPDLATSPATAEGRINAVPRDRDNMRAESAADQASKPRPSPSARYLALSGYGGRDPNVLRLLESLTVANNPPGALDLGPDINRDRRRLLTQRNASVGHDRRWEVSGITVASFSEHSGSVNRVIVSPDQVFFVTGSDDGSIKLWDVSRLERNVAHRSRQTYKHASGARVTAMTFVDNTHAFVSAASDGSVHILRPDVSKVGSGVFKYNKVRLLRSWRIPVTSSYAVWVEHIKQRTVNILLIATNTGQVHALNISNMSLEYTIQNPAHHGAPTCFCISPKAQHWLLIGTSRGILDLWDLRFRVRLNSLAFQDGCPITRLIIPSEGTGDAVSSSSADGTSIVYISGGLNSPEVTAWTTADFKCVGTWRSAGAVTLQTQQASTNRRLSAMASVPNTKRYSLTNADGNDGLKDLKTTVRQGGSNGSGTTTGTIAEQTSDGASIQTFVMGSTESASGDDTRPIPYLFAGGPETSLRMWNLKKGQTNRSFYVAGLPKNRNVAEPPLFEQIGVWSGIAFYDEVMPNGAEKRAALSEKNRKAGDGSLSTAKGNAQTGQDPEPSGAETTGDGDTSGKDGHKAPQSRLEPQSLLRQHLDTITDVAVIDVPFRMFVSVDRSGSIFVFA